MTVIGTGSLAFLFFNSGYNVPFAGPHPDVVAPATFVGSGACAGCHHAEADLWNTSQHKHAMQHATAASVLAILMTRASIITACIPAFSKKMEIRC